MPIELHIHAAGPLNHGVLADGIIEWRHEDIGAVGLSCMDGGVEVGDQIARALGSERVRNRRLESENR